MDNAIIQTFLNSIHLQQFGWWMFALAFAGGIISSISPCTLGLLPVIIGYVGGYSGEGKGAKTTIQVTFFILGLSLVLTFLGVTSALTGQVFGSHAGPVWILVMASLILIMGLNLLEIIEIPMPAIIKQMPQNKSNGLVIYPIVIGGTFALATTPCSTPILAGIMAYTSLKANIALGGMLLFLFSLGQGVILILAGIFTSMFQKLLFIRTYSHQFMKFSGIILILTGLFFYFKVFSAL